MKIIGSDYDGTLNYNGIDEAKRRAIARWRFAGNKFAIVSGRGIQSLLNLYRNDALECDYLVACSGAVIAQTDGTLVYTAQCDGSLAKPLLRHLFAKGCKVAYISGALPLEVHACPASCTGDLQYTLDTLPEIPFFYQISTVSTDTDMAAQVTASVKASFGDRLNPLQNGICIDIVRQDMNKAKGLHRLRELLGIRHEDVITVGDNVNDKDMIEAFRSYAMANGVDMIKELADDITPGITELIDKELCAAQMKTVE